MSTIRLLGLGGLAENGKNMYVVEIDQDIFILEAGIQNPPTDLFGVDFVLPDMSYLTENKDRLRGVFLSHGHEDKIGAVADVLRLVKIPIYGSRFTLKIVEDNLDQSNAGGFKQFLHEIKESDVLRFNQTKVSFFSTTHSIPESLGIAFHTPDGVIVYTGDFSFNPHIKPLYKTSFDKITAFKQEGVLALLTDSIGAPYASTGDANYMLEHSLRETLQRPGRVIVSSFSSELDKIQMAIDIALQQKRKIAIIGRKAQRIIDISVTLGYLTIPEDSLVSLRFIDAKNDNYDDNMMVLVAGEKHEPYFMLQRIARKRDKLIHATEKDTFFIMHVPLPGVEKMASATIDFLYRAGSKVQLVERRILRGSHASQVDIKLLLNFLEPRFVFPVLGEPRHQYAVEQVALSYGIPKSRIISLVNGQIATFIGGKMNEKFTYYKVGDNLVDGSILRDVNEVVLKDRELLGRDGVLFVIGNVDARAHKLVSEIEVVAQGFAIESESPQVFEDIKKVAKQAAEDHLLEKYVDWNVLRQEVKDAVYKHLMSTMRRGSLIIPIMIDTVRS